MKNRAQVKTKDTVGEKASSFFLTLSDVGCVRLRSKIEIGDCEATHGVSRRVPRCQRVTTVRVYVVFPLLTALLNQTTLLPFSFPIQFSFF